MSLPYSVAPFRGNAARWRTGDERCGHDKSDPSHSWSRRAPDHRYLLALDGHQRIVRSTSFVTAVKTAIPWGFLLLIPALTATGGSGFGLAKGAHGGLIGTKLKRMPFIAGNGLLILIPCALFLASKARGSQFDTSFYIVQALELVAGATNLTLLGLNMRDGFHFTGRLPSTNERPTARPIARRRRQAAPGRFLRRATRSKALRRAAGTRRR